MTKLSTTILEISSKEINISLNTFVYAYKRSQLFVAMLNGSYSLYTLKTARLIQIEYAKVIIFTTTDCEAPGIHAHPY